MSSSEPHVATPNLDKLIETVASQLQAYKNNFTSQLNDTFTRLTPQQVIRMVIIIGAYCLLRPYLIKMGARFQARDHEREVDHEEIQKMRKSEGYNRGSLKDKVDIPEDTDSESGEDANASSTGTSWGKKARRRQRRVMRQLLEADEKRRLEEEEAESDKELEQWMN